MPARAAKSPRSRAAPRAQATGTQALARGIGLLRMLATRGEIGWRLSDLAAACGLEKATAHRMLNRLVEERLVQQRPADRRYLLGPLLFELAVSQPAHHEFRAAAQARLDAWARRMDAVALLLLRSGFEYVCGVRAGTARVPGLLVYEGTRRPLFTSVGGVAILQTLPKDEAREVLANNVAQEVQRRGKDRLPLLEKMRTRSAKHGFGVNLGDVAAGVHAFAVPLRGADGRAFAALCLTGTADQFPDGRIDAVRAELLRMAKDLEADAATLLVPPGSRAA